MAFDRVFAWAKVVASSVKSATSETLYNLAGAAGSDDPDDPDDDALGEVANNQEVFSALGIVGRPRPPEKGSDSITRFLEALGVRTMDGLLPIAFRDRRLHENFPNPKEGTVAFVGYGGAFLSFDDGTTSFNGKKATVVTLYVPYDFNSSGVAQKAFSVIIDPDTKAMSLIHGKGQALLFQDDGSITAQSPNASSFLKLENGKITLQTDQLVLNGGAVVIGNPTGLIVPLAAGAASPPCPRLFLNPAV